MAAISSSKKSHCKIFWAKIFFKSKGQEAEICHTKKMDTLYFPRKYFFLLKKLANANSADWPEACCEGLVHSQMAIRGQPIIIIINIHQQHHYHHREEYTWDKVTKLLLDNFHYATLNMVAMNFLWIIWFCRGNVALTAAIFGYNV